MNPSSNLFLVGPSGAGKTSIGRRLAEHYNLTFLDLDHQIEERTGVDVSTIFEIEGEAGFRYREAAILNQCSQHEHVLLATGAGAILDATSRSRLSRRGFVVWLQASVEQQLKRLQHDRARPLLAGINRHQRLCDMATRRNPLYAELAELVISGHNERPQRAFDRCRTCIDQYWQRFQATAS